MDRKFETRYGYFNAAGNEFIITDPLTPKPWVNVISNGSYGLVVSQLNGGFSWIGHSNFNRLTRWQQDLVMDNWGKYIYLRDDATREFWSPTFKPVMQQLDAFQCHHGIGYSTFVSRYLQIEARLRLFVPFGDDLEIWSLTLKNLGKTPRQLSIFTYFEWCLGAAPDNHREFHKTFLETEFNAPQQTLLARKRLWEVPTDRGHWNADWDRTAYFAASEPVDGFEGDKQAFIGNYRDLSHPRALETGTLAGTLGKWNDSIAALKKSVTLESGAERTLHFYLGAETQPERIFDVLARYRSPETIQSAFESMQQKWAELLGATTVETPDAALNFMTNTWLKYQTISGRLWGRTAYYQQSGAFGFRDQLQDSQIWLYIDPELTHKQILLHAAHQFASGKVLHWWHPITEEGLASNYSDDLLWLPFVTIQYLKETANWAILDEPIPFYDDSNPASLLEHCLRAIDLALTRFSPRGLPLILGGDWNDGLSGVGLEGRGESIWMAHFLYFILNEMQPVLRQQHRTGESENFTKRAGQLKLALNDLGWDGAWFWRATDDRGRILGSAKNAEGRIFLNAQIWAVIANSATAERQNQVMNAAEAHLFKDSGPLLFQPAFKTPDPFIGYLSRYAPGVRENGGIYTHAATWAIWAECRLKRNQQAWEAYQKICPIYPGMAPDVYCAEPYVTPGNIDGPDSPHAGRGGWTWYTGSAAWLFRVTLDFLLGIRADYDGLVVDPCLPADWKSVSIRRLFRGTTYLFEIERTEKNPSGAMEIEVDGQKIAGNQIPIISGKAEVEITVRV